MVFIQQEIVNNIKNLSIINSKFFINSFFICDIYDNIEIAGFDKYYDIDMDKVYNFNWVKDENNIKLIIKGF